MEKMAVQESRGYIYTWNEYEELKQQDKWKGGWVRTLDKELKYIDSNGREYDSTLGSQENPFPMHVFDEMESNGTWAGGWVRLQNGQVIYVKDFNSDFGSGTGCGSGSGSGCGCGCGCGSGSDGDGGDLAPSACHIVGGEYRIGTLMQASNYVGDVYIEWTPGNTDGGQGMANAYLTIKYTPANYRVYNNTRCKWIAPYTISFDGYLVVENSLLRFDYDINGEFIIPSTYRV